VHYLKTSFAVATFIESLDPETLRASRSRLILIQPFRGHDFETIEETAAHHQGIRALVVAARDHISLGVVVFQADHDDAYIRLERLADTDLVGDAAVRASGETPARLRAADEVRSAPRAA
jgi:hypothetical protein